MSDSGTRSRAGVGVSSVLMVLVVLAMAALSVLAYTSTRATEAMTQRNVQVTEGYYRAFAQVQERLSAIDQAVLEQPRPCEDALAWYRGRAIPDVEWSQEDDGLRFTVTVADEEGRGAEAAGVLQAEAGERYRLLYCRTVTHDQAEEADNLNLMGV